MIYILVSCKGMVEIQLTFEQHGFELSGFTFMWIFLNKYILLCDTVYSCLNSWIQSQGYRGLTIKFYRIFYCAPLTSLLFKDPLYCNTMCCHVYRPSFSFSDITLISRNWPRQNYLHHGNQWREQKLPLKNVYLAWGLSS